MTLPDIVSPDEWLVARKSLLTREKEFTRANDALNADRRRLPMTELAKDYTFRGPNGNVGLVDLFDGRRQLVVQHIMFDPSWDDACPSCTAGVDELAEGLLDHLHVRDTTFVAVSRAPFAKLDDYRVRKSWTIPWYSSEGSDFNYDFHVTIDATRAPVMFNYRNASELSENGMDWILDGSSEQPGYSCFLRDGDRIFHTYSTFGRGTEQLGGAYAFLDMTALGRQEEWEEPTGRSEAVRAAMPDFAS
jgi:predicted dithiol-disulfide oxidoreductase (DUF899 family)